MSTQVKKKKPQAAGVPRKVVIEFNDPKNKLNRDTLIANLTNMIRVMYYDKDVKELEVNIGGKVYKFKIV